MWNLQFHDNLILQIWAFPKFAKLNCMQNQLVLQYPVLDVSQREWKVGILNYKYTIQIPTLPIFQKSNLVNLHDRRKYKSTTLHCAPFTLCTVCYLQVELRSGEWVHYFNLPVPFVFNALRLMSAQLRLPLTAYAPQYAHIWAKNWGSPHKWWNRAKSKYRALGMYPALYVFATYFVCSHYFRDVFYSICLCFVVVEFDFIRYGSVLWIHNLNFNFATASGEGLHCEMRWLGDSITFLLNTWAISSNL